MCRDGVVLGLLLWSLSCLIADLLACDGAFGGYGGICRSLTLAVAFQYGAGWRDDVENASQCHSWNFSVIIRLLFITGQNG